MTQQTWNLPAGIEAFDATDRAEWLKRRKQSKAVTCSAAGCLVGVHEFLTPYEYWAQQSGLVEPKNIDSDLADRGNDLELVTIKRVERLRPEWKIWQPSVFLLDAAARIGGTPDAAVICPERGLGNLQLKSTVDSVFKSKWFDENGAVSPPLWIAIQSLLEAHLMGAQWAAVAVMVLSGYGVGIDVHIIDIPMNERLIQRLYTEAKEFWRRVEENDPYPVDYARDGALLADIYSETNEGEIVDLSGDNRALAIVDEYQTVSEMAKAAEEKKKSLQAEMIAKMGTASEARVNGRTIATRKMQIRKAHFVEETQFPVLRFKKPKAA